MLQNSPLNVGKHAVAAVGSCLCVMTIHTLNVIEVRTVHLVGHVKHPYLAPTAVLMTQARLGRNSRVDVVRTGEGESTQLCTNDAAGLARPLGGVHASFLACSKRTSGPHGVLNYVNTQSVEALALRKGLL